jgi:hypothetical protein
MNTITSAPTGASPRTTRGRALRLVAGAIVAGAALTAMPAMADAASSCSYSNKFKSISVSTDVNGGGPTEVLMLERRGQNIVFADGVQGTRTPCFGDGAVGTVTNTDRVIVLGLPRNGIQIDQRGGVLAPGFTPEPGATSEIETVIVSPLGKRVHVVGTAAPEVMRIGGNGQVMLGSDPGVDIRYSGTAPGAVSVQGGGGADFLTGRGAPGQLAPSSVQVFLHGEGDADTLVDSTSINQDSLDGGSGDDTLYAFDGNRDFVNGDVGFDTATIDFEDVHGSDTERTKIDLSQIGRLRLAPASVNARAGKPAQLKLSWTHPKAWRQLSKVELRVYRNNELVGKVLARPKSGRLTDSGATKLVAGGSTLAHHDKTVTAKLALRLRKSLAGQNLRLEVQATDRKGRTQTEPDAGTIHVAQ